MPKPKRITWRAYHQECKALDLPVNHLICRYVKQTESDRQQAQAKVDRLKELLQEAAHFINLLREE